MGVVAVSEPMAELEGPDVFPYYCWEVFGDSPGAAYLYRRTNAEKKLLFQCVERDGSHVDHRRFHSLDPEWLPGGQEFRGPDHGATVRDVFLAAVKAAFVRAPSTFSREELTSIRERLVWYELEALDALRDGRGDDNREPGAVEPAALPPEAWKFINHAHEETTALSEYITTDRSEDSLTTQVCASCGEPIEGGDHRCPEAPKGWYDE